jgi:hypothetical protein
MIIISIAFRPSWLHVATLLLGGVMVGYYLSRRLLPESKAIDIWIGGLGFAFAVIGPGEIVLGYGVEDARWWIGLGWFVVALCLPFYVFRKRGVEVCRKLAEET